MAQSYEMVIGLEVHIELKTQTKIFCSCPTTFGAEPNTQCCPVCTGMPGALPVLNQQVVDDAIKAGLATHCSIAPYSKQDRKNYFYPDLPKAYQISQYDLPLCLQGYLDIEGPQGSKRIGITRIHIEEDAGKLVHDPQRGTLIDCNRCGVPLIEIVSEPDIRSAQEAVSYLKKLRAIILYIGISDCRMNEGSMRCDVNLSVRPAGSDRLGIRTEIKNLNSFQFVQRAIEYEYQRQVEALARGEAVVQQTLRFDQASGRTFPMRGKEDAHDYRYFPDPDLPPISTCTEQLNRLKAQIPMLPDQRKALYMKQYGLSALACEALVTDAQTAGYFEEAAALCRYPRLLGNLMTTEAYRLMDGEDGTIPISPLHMAQLADMLGDEAISSSTAKRALAGLWQADQEPRDWVLAHDLLQINDPDLLIPAVEAVLAREGRLADRYRSGKINALQALTGKAIAATGGKGNPSVLQRLLKERL